MGAFISPPAEHFPAWAGTVRVSMIALLAPKLTWKLVGAQ